MTTGEPAPVPAPEPGPPPGGPSTAETAERLGALWLDTLANVREASTAQFQHDDTMLTWAIGLMGAGALYANNLSADAPRGLRALATRALGPRDSRLHHARVMGSRLLQNGATWYLTEILSFQGDVVASKDLVMTVKAMIASLGRMAKEASKDRSGLLGWWRRLSLAAHILLGVGILAVVAVSFWADK
jgi:hypothetical protein